MSKPNEISRKIRTHLEVDGTGDPRLWLGPAADEIDRLHALVNSPVYEPFIKAVNMEAAHQVDRWGTAHDKGKDPADWFWLVGYLAGKALRADIDHDREKALHHTISTAAALLNWHAAILGADNRMRPGHGEPLA